MEIDHKREKKVVLIYEFNATNIYNRNARAAMQLPCCPATTVERRHYGASRSYSE
jgi:hypothetical protein